MHDFIKKYHWIIHPYLHSITAAIVFIAAIFGIWFGAEDALLDYWNKNIVLTYISSISSNWVLTWACILISIFALVVAAYRFVIRYQYRLSAVTVVLVLITLLTHYRFIETNLYDFVSPWNKGFKYVDFLLIWLGLYIIASIVNFIRIKSKGEQIASEKVTKPKAKRLGDGLLIPVLQSDNPIENIDEDELDYDKEIEKLIAEITDLDASQSWSIAISAPWSRKDFVSELAQEKFPFSKF